MCESIVMRASEARLAADYLGRAETFVDQVAPDLASDIEQLRGRLLQVVRQLLAMGSQVADSDQ